MLNTSMVFVANKISMDAPFSIKRTDCEGSSSQAISSIREALTELFTEVYFYDSPEKFAKHAEKHLNDIVLSSYYGAASPSSKSFIPSICEIYNIKYVGGSSYTHMLCNDKYLSKLYVKNFGLKTAPAVLIRNPYNKDDYELLDLINYPAIVKPNYGGGSNGICSNNVINSREETFTYCKKLFEYQKLPLIVEEYIPGYEVELILAGTNKDVHFNQEVGIRVDGKDYFNTEIYGLESKKAHSVTHDYINSNYVSKDDWEKTKALFCSFSKMDFMRVDCRIYNGDAYVLELSPDCFLGPTGGFYHGFKFQGYSYLEMFKTLFKYSIR